MIGPCPFPILGLVNIAEFTYLIPNSQDFFRLFPHEKNEAIAVDNVHPVPCVFLVFNLLLENILKLGAIGDVVKVKAGYGRNYLLKKGKALRASKENISHVNSKKAELKKKEDETKIKFKEIASKLKNKKVKFAKEAKDNGELYGSIKPKEITVEIKNSLNIDVSPSQIEIKQDIKSLGDFTILINLYSGVSVPLIATVTKTQTS